MCTNGENDRCAETQSLFGHIQAHQRMLLLLLFAMIRSVVKSFKVPDVEVAAARMSNESGLTRMTDSTP